MGGGAETGLQASVSVHENGGGACRGQQDVNKQPGHMRPGWVSVGRITGLDKESAANPDTIKASFRRTVPLMTPPCP